MKEHDPNMAELLRRDAERIREHEAFDAKLHHDTLRAIRQLEPSRPQGWFSLQRVTVAFAAVAACVILLVVLRPDPGVAPANRIMAATAAPTTALSYRSALSEGEDALLAMLDADARVLLPQSASVFQTDH